MFLYGHRFNFRLVAWTETRKARKWECFQNAAFSLQYIYKSCKEIARSPTPAYLEHRESASESLFLTATFTPLAPQNAAYCRYAVTSAVRSWRLSEIRRNVLEVHLPNREAGKQQFFGVSKVDQCKAMGTLLPFSISFWPNCSSSEHLRHLLKISLVFCDCVAPHPTGMAHHQLCNEITTGNPGR